MTKENALELVEQLNKVGIATSMLHEMLVGRNTPLLAVSSFNHPLIDDGPVDPASFYVAIEVQRLSDQTDALQSWLLCCADHALTNTEAVTEYLRQGGTVEERLRKLEAEK